MSVRFIIGRSGSGKSQRCFDEIREKLVKEAEGTPLILIVPEQATFQCEQTFVNHPDLGGTIRAQVLSFHRLAWRIMQEQGGTSLLPMNELSKQLLIYHLLQQRKDEFKLFHNSIDKIGFVEQIQQLFTEFKRYGITPDRLEEQLKVHRQQIESLRNFEDKITDISLLYRYYIQYVAKRFLDGEDYLTLLTEQIPQSTYVKQAEIWIDGFHGYTPQELQIVKQLISTSHHVSITLCLNRAYEADDDYDELDMFFPTARTMIELQQLIQQLDTSPSEIMILDQYTSPRFLQSPALAHLEQNFEYRYGGNQRLTFELPTDLHIHLDDQLVMKQAVNLRAEVEGAARDMLKLSREKGVRYREMAIVVRNMDSYSDLLRTTLTDMGIPHFFDQKRTVLHHPLVEFIRSALEVAEKNWSYDAVFRCVKTDLFVPLDQDQREYRTCVDQLENYVLAHGIKGYRWTEEKRWSDQRVASLEYDEQLNTTRNSIAQPLDAYVQKLKQSRDLKEHVSALYSLLEEVEVARKLDLWGQVAWKQGHPDKAREHWQIWQQVIDLLDQLVESIGDLSLTLAQCTGLLDRGLEGIRLGLVPPSLDQVLIGNMDRTRSNHIPYVYVLGITEGVIPARVQEQGIITENEREWLSTMGIQIADSAKRKLLQESFIMYTSLTLASRRLWLSYPLANEEGASLLPSELIKQITRMFPQLSIGMLYTEPAKGMDDTQLQNYLIDPRQSLSYLAVRIKQWLVGDPISPVWLEMYNWYVGDAQWHPYIDSLIRAFQFTNYEPRLSPEVTQQLYGNHLLTSVSRMERFIACPFAHFASYGLKLKERPIYRLDSPDIGQLFHDALHEFVLQLEADHIDWAELSDEACMSRANQVVDRLTPRLQSEILLSSSRYRYVARKLKQIVGRATQILGLHARQSEFKPIGLEIDFGPNKDIPSLHFPLENHQEMELIGRIDRVDHLRLPTYPHTDYLRVIDYKSSAKKLNLFEVQMGLSLQMLAYLDVVLTHAKTWLGHEALPAAALYFHVHDPIILSKNLISKNEADRLIRMKFKTKGLVTADPELIGYMDKQFTESLGASELIPAKLKKDGNFYAHSSVLTHQQWTTLRQHVRQHIKTVGSKILSGHVEIEPYRMGKQTACQYCSFKPVCHYDPLFEGNVMNVWQQKNKKQAWLEIEQNVSQHPQLNIDEGR